MAEAKIIFEFVLIFSVFGYSGVGGQSIKFENGRYNGIVIGIDGNKIDERECGNIRRNLELILPEFSKSLWESTLGKAETGQVYVLLPHNWNEASCGLQNTRRASTLHSYENSHFQITTDHPLAETLPWTKQYKPCAHEGDSIVFPLSFINNSMLFPESIRGKLMLAEWAKYRYGVFDEIGFATEDKSFPACYTKERQAYLSTCTSVQLPAIAANKSACSVEFLIKNKENQIGYMMESPTSVLSAPFIDQSSTNHFCDASTHNPWTDTKHNFYCEKKSVSEIIYQHRDFKNMQNQQQPQQSEPGRVDIRFLKHDRQYLPAYAFMIEDSKEMRDTRKLLHVKQALAQFLEILKDGVEVQIFIFSGENRIISKANELNSTNNDKIRKEMLSFIPDLNSEPIPTNWIGELTPIITSKLSAPEKYSWNVFLFTSSSSYVTDMDLAINEFQQTNHTISVITFDSGHETNEKEWLKWYGIRNTQNVIFLPYCRSSASQGLCSLRMSSLIVEHFTSQLNNQQFGPRLLQKTNEVEIQNTVGHTEFYLNGDPFQIYILMSIPENASIPGDSVNIVSPNGFTCATEQLLGYGYVLKFHIGACMQEMLKKRVSGPWWVIIKKRLSSDPNINTLFLNVFQEARDQINLSVVPSLGMQDLSQELQPNSQMTPVFVSVSTKHGNPILGAAVSLQIYHPGLVAMGDSQNGTTIALRDDGDSSNGADQTENDGVYSAYLAGYSRESPSFHLGSVQVLTNDNSRILSKIQSPKAAYLHEQMTDKCCGKSIQPAETNTLPHFTFQTLLPGCKTLEPWNNARLQPGRITYMSISEENDFQISLQFSRVAGDINDPTVNVESFQACCVPTNITMEPDPVPTGNDCKPDTTNIISQGSDPVQTVQMDKEVLVKQFVPVEADRSSVDSLQCALRAVNSNSEFGLPSSTAVKVDVAVVIAGGGLGESGDEAKCDFSISDDCLPILIFWILIGCVALLFLLLVIALIICCWCMSKNKKKVPKDDQRRRRSDMERSPRLENDVMNKYDKSPVNNIHNSTNNANIPIEKEEPKVVKELFVNHAYIQDGDGEIKIIADSGEILRKPLNNSPPPNVGGEGHDTAMSPRFKRNIQITRPPPQEEQVVMEMPHQDMQIFKPEPYPKTKKSPSKQQRNLKRQKDQHQRPEIIHANPNLRSDSLQNIPQHQPQVAIFTSPIHDPDPTVYATVSRATRMKPSNNYIDHSNTSPPKSIPVDPHYMVPVHHHNSLPRMVQHRSRDPLPNFNPPPQVHPYPSSASDSSMPSPIQNQRRPPRFTKPPPYPAGSQMVMTMSRPQSGQSHHSTFSGGQQLPTTTRINPALPVQPPVPPPRFNDRSASRASPGPLRSFSPRQNNMPSDEDSDQWDDGDNFDQGYSYA